MTIIIALIVFWSHSYSSWNGTFLYCKVFWCYGTWIFCRNGAKVIVAKQKETEYSLRALPLGGYVRMEGEDSESQDPNSFNNKHPLKRMAIIFAGPFMNFYSYNCINVIFVYDDWCSS